MWDRGSGDLQIIETATVRAGRVPGVLDEVAGALVGVARVLALELGVGETGLDGHRHAKGLNFFFIGYRPR